MIKFIQKHGELLFAIIILLMVLLGLILFVSMQDTNGRKKAPEAPTATPEPTPTKDNIDIIFIDDIPTAVLREPTGTNTPTQKPTATPTEMPLPTPTATQKPTNMPKPTNTPQPTKKPTATPKTTYTEGKAGTFSVPDGKHDWKPYARHTKITRKTSQQYKLQLIAKTDDNGLRYVTVDGVKRYCVALPVYWAGGSPSDVGRCFDVHMKNGATLHCVLGDVKKIEDSQNGEGKFGSKGELLEFQVDIDKLPKHVHGDISDLGGEFEGNADKIIVYDKNALK